jgi:raffinose/stachyose/melibiose transport system substrate-binding protein
MIATGKAVMMPAVSLFTANIKAANPNGKYSSFPVPGDTAKDTRLMVYVSQGLAVNAKSKNIAAARAFVNFMATKPEAAAWARANGQIPVQQFGTKNPRLAPEFAPLKNLIKRGKTVLSPFSFWPTASTTTELGKGVQTIYTGQTSVSDVLAKLDSTWGK